MASLESLPRPPAIPGSRSWLRAEAWPLALIAFGTVLRLQQYLANPSLRLDEALLALNLVNRSFSGLLQPLDHGQGAPPLFLLAERLAVELAGPSEYAMRALPLLASLASLPLLYLLARRWVGKPGALLALALFAVSYEPIRFSREVKQYSLDVLIALLLYLGLDSALSRPLRWGRVVLWGLLGVCAIFTSHPAVFILGGMALFPLQQHLRRREWPRLLSLGAVCLLWGVGLAGFYWLFARNLHGSRALANYWDFGYVPFPPRSLSDLRWPFETFFTFFSNPGGFQYSAVAALPFFAGCVSFIHRDPRRAWYLLGPMLAVLCAALLHVYPFGDRLTLFLVPGMLLLIAEGAQYFARKLGRRAPVTVFLLALLLVPVYLRVPTMVTEPGMVRDVRPLLQYVAEHRQPGDLIYVYRFAWAATTFYMPRFGLDAKDMIWGQESSHTDEFARTAELRKIAGRGRVWLVFAQEVPGWQGITDEKYLVHYLEAHAQKLDSRKRLNAALYLYDLTNTPPPEADLRAEPGAPAGAPTELGGAE